MIRLRTTHRRSTAPLAALLLLLQGLAGGAVSLAHASERFTAPAHVEAQHSSSCLALHDALRCTLCHYAGTRGVPQQARVQPPPTSGPERPCARAEVVRASDPGYLTASPRAPPPASL